MERAVLIFSGYNQRAVVAFMRTLEHRLVPYAIIAGSSEDPLFQTAYAPHILATRTKKALDLEDMETAIETVRPKLGAQRYIVAPSTEALNRFLIVHRPEFEQAGCHIPLPDQALYETVSDKYAFGELCRQNGITVPQEYDTVPDGETRYVAKPRKYVSADGMTYAPILVTDQAEHHAFIRSHHTDDFYFQQFVEGESLYLLLYCYQDGSVAKYSQQNYIQQPDGKSILAARPAELHHEAALTDRFTKLFATIGFSGLVMVEIKRQQGVDYMIEANPRFWGPSQLFVDAGMNLFEAFLYDQGLLAKKPLMTETKREARYFWSGGFSAESPPDDTAVAYHSYDSGHFSEELADWLAWDVYNREDTRAIYNKRG